MKADLLHSLQWRKSSYSASQSNCVEVAGFGSGLAVRDSRNPGHGILAFDAPDWRAFVEAVRTGELAE